MKYLDQRKTVNYSYNVLCLYSSHIQVQHAVSLYIVSTINAMLTQCVYPMKYRKTTAVCVHWEKLGSTVTRVNILNINKCKIGKLPE